MVNFVRVGIKFLNFISTPTNTLHLKSYKRERMCSDDEIS